jgi:archaeosortase A (PGF-CTERM-specific)
MSAMPLWTYAALDMLLIVSMCLLGAGLASKRKGFHLLRAAGWAGFGAYWGLQAPHYAGIDDWFNVLGCLMAMPIFCYIGYHEYLSHKWNDEYPPLRFVGWAMFIASVGFMVVDKVPAVSGALIDVVARQSVWLANLFGHDFGTAGVDYFGNPWYYKTQYLPENEVSVALVGIDIRIVLACTAIQALLITAAFIFASRGPGRTKWEVFAVVAPSIYLVNLARNSLVILLVDANGIGYFDFAHNVVGKSISLAALVVLVLYAFWRMPEMYEDINGAFDLFWRKGPKHDYVSNVGRVFELAAGKRGNGNPPPKE